MLIASLYNAHTAQLNDHTQDYSVPWWITWWINTAKTGSDVKNGMNLLCPLLNVRHMGF